MRGLFGAIVVRERGAPPPDVEHVLFMHTFPPQVTDIPRLLHCVNGRSVRRQHAHDARRESASDVAIHVMGSDGNFHTFHIHGHRWRDSSGAFADCPTFGPNETITARFTRGQPRALALPLPRLSHQDAGMAGWYIWGTVTQEEEQRMSVATRGRRHAAALLAPATAPARNDYPPPGDPGKGRGARQGQAQTLQVCKSKGCRYKTITAAVKAGRGRRHDPGQPRHLQGGRAITASATTA